MKKTCNICNKNEVLGLWYPPAQRVLSDTCSTCYNKSANDIANQNSKSYTGNGNCYYCGSLMSEDGCYTCRSEAEKKKKR